MSPTATTALQQLVVHGESAHRGVARIPAAWFATNSRQPGRAKDEDVYEGRRYVGSPAKRAQSRREWNPRCWSKTTYERQFVDKSGVEHRAALKAPWTIQDSRKLLDDKWHSTPGGILHRSQTVSDCKAKHGETECRHAYAAWSKEEYAAAKPENAFLEDRRRCIQATYRRAATRKFAAEQEKVLVAKRQGQFAMSSDIMPRRGSRSSASSNSKLLRSQSGSSRLSSTCLSETTRSAGTRPASAQKRHALLSLLKAASGGAADYAPSGVSEPTWFSSRLQQDATMLKSATDDQNVSWTSSRTKSISHSTAPASLHTRSGQTSSSAPRFDTSPCLVDDVDDCSIIMDDDAASMGGDSVYSSRSCKPTENSARSPDGSRGRPTSARLPSSLGSSCTEERTRRRPRSADSFSRRLSVVQEVAQSIAADLREPLLGLHSLHPPKHYATSSKSTQPPSAGSVTSSVPTPPSVCLEPARSSTCSTPDYFDAASPLTQKKSTQAGRRLTTTTTSCGRAHRNHMAYCSDFDVKQQQQVFLKRQPTNYTKT
eukprot:TRINITY_DN54332_c0_g1_i9.p1 TRINITY_DN54332_c0_g1~~TRINITY_DN54332_c0_g1_i9.p1  ORF type:complete len:584 (-),score=35.95 TRINITY_DN54332_c0_g1_i9:24-1649(-)